MALREKINKAPLQKVYLLTPDQLARLLGKERERVESLHRQSTEALGRAEREVQRHGNAASAYTLFRGAQERHLQAAAREREEPVRIDGVEQEPREEKKITKLPTVGIEPQPTVDTKALVPPAEPTVPLAPLTRPPSPPPKPRAAPTAPRSIPWLLRSKTKMGRNT